MFKLQRSYSSLGHLHHSVTLFHSTSNPNVFLWTPIIHADTHFGLYHHTLSYYSQMLVHPIQPNAFTPSSLLKACTLHPIKVVHSHAIKSLVSYTTMLTCYTKHGMLPEVRVLFERMGVKDVVCWNVMIDGYAQHGCPYGALVPFRKMMMMHGNGNGKVRPNEITIEVVLLVHWSVVGYGIHGFGDEALQLFHDMCYVEVKPSDITFVAALTTCVHAGLVYGESSWLSWARVRSLRPCEEHGEHKDLETLHELKGPMTRSNSKLLQEEMAKRIKDGLLVKGKEGENHKELNWSMLKIVEQHWGTLLWACRIHSNVSFGEEIAEFLVSNGLASSGTYVLLSNMYAAAGNWVGVAKVRSMMKGSGVEKEPGCSSIEVNNRVHEFLAGDLRHPRSKDIYSMLKKMNAWLKARGYTPKTDVVLHDIGEREKEQSLEVHSEKLALAFGLISTSPGAAIKIVKNLRVCLDCHAVMKMMSKISGRKIIMRPEPVSPL
ncbi:hypothetical protein JHK82_012482 [Glycine max]|nr:hypothetical protein JHK85_012837 [Glycine max]KAG5154513.1 hypothetical protein JHK82_012482 [Glycine max]